MIEREWEVPERIGQWVAVHLNEPQKGKNKPESHVAVYLGVFNPIWNTDDIRKEPWYFIPSKLLRISGRHCRFSLLSAKLDGLTVQTKLPNRTSLYVQDDIGGTTVRTTNIVLDADTFIASTSTEILRRYVDGRERVVLPITNEGTEGCLLLDRLQFPEFDYPVHN